MSNWNRIHTRLCAAVLISALVTLGSVAAWAQHRGHNMQDMPGMNKRKPKAKRKSKRKTRPRARPNTRRRRSAWGAPNKNGMSGTNLNGMDMRGMGMPAKSPTPAPSPSAGQTRMENMPGMKMPAASPTPAAPSQQSDMSNMPMPQASPSPAAGVSSTEPTMKLRARFVMPLIFVSSSPTPAFARTQTALNPAARGFRSSHMSRSLLLAR